MQTGQLDLVEKGMEKQLAESPVDYDILANQAVLAALRGDFAKAKSSLPAIFAKVQHNDENYHHETYQAACVYALEGNNVEAVKWLRETANTGFPNYPLFARDKFLDRIRQSPDFIQFLAEQKAQWERFEQEFPDA
jgi:glutathionylspermidine synthase